MAFRRVVGPSSGQTVQRVAAGWGHTSTTPHLASLSDCPSSSILVAQRCLLSTTTGLGSQASSSSMASFISTAPSSSLLGHDPTQKSAASRSLNADPLSDVILARLEKLEREVKFMKRYRQVATATSSPGAVATTTDLGSGISPSAVGGSENILHQDCSLSSDPIPLENDGAPTRISPQVASDLYQFYSMLPDSTYPLNRLYAMETLDDLHRYAPQLWREFTVRIAQRTVAMSTAPYGLCHMPSIGHLQRWYELSFQDIREAFPEAPSTEDDLRRFDSLMRKIFKRHGNTAYLFGHGIMEFAQREGWTEKRLLDTAVYREYADMELFFHQFVKSRVALRFLLQHYLDCSEKLLRLQDLDHEVRTEEDPTFGHSVPFVGAICSSCNIVKVAQYAIEEAKKEAEVDNFCEVPEITLKVAGDADFSFVHPPAMSHNIISALVGDALRKSTIKTCRDGSPQHPIEVLISQQSSNSDVVVRVSSVAGGIPHTLLNHATGYIYSCRSFYDDRAVLSSPSSSVSKPQGWMKSAVRLPYAKAAAQVFGGDVTVASIDGHSSDRHYYIPCHGLAGLNV